MTETDLEIQRLRREVKYLRDENDRLNKQHGLDLSQLAYYRRQIDFLMDAAREAETDEKIH